MSMTITTICATVAWAPPTTSMRAGEGDAAWPDGRESRAGRAGVASEAGGARGDGSVGTRACLKGIREDGVHARAMRVRVGALAYTHENTNTEEHSEMHTGAPTPHPPNTHSRARASRMRAWRLAHALAETRKDSETRGEAETRPDNIIWCDITYDIRQSDITHYRNM